jgi:hypothetical protein
MRRDDDGIDPPLWFRAVTPSSGNSKIEHIRRGTETSGSHSDAADRQFRRTVKREDRIKSRIVDRSIENHRKRPTGRFLRRLEKKDDISSKAFATPRKKAGRPEDSRNMDIVPAGVHDSGIPRRERGSGTFSDRQRVHIRAEARRPAGSDAAKHADDPRPGAPPRPDSDSHQLGLDHSGSPSKVEIQFRKLMDRAPHGNRNPGVITRLVEKGDRLAGGIVKSYTHLRISPLLTGSLTPIY